MADVVLGPAAQAALQSLLAVESRPTGRHQRVGVLEKLAVLVRCDALGVATADDTGLVLDSLSLPSHHLDWIGPQACDGPFALGVRQMSREPHDALLLAQHGIRDSINVTFRSGRAYATQVWFDRQGRPFDDRDLLLLGTLAPLLGRLFRDHPVARLPGALTTCERRVLQLVATGLTNGEIAERLSVTGSTVRKHLENAYRKLGVSNRVAAVRQFEGWLVDLPERVERVGRVEA